MKGKNFCLVRMYKIDVPEGTESLVPISLFVWKILRKNERGALNSPPPVSRGLRCMAFDLAAREGHSIAFPDSISGSRSEVIDPKR